MSRLLKGANKAAAIILALGEEDAAPLFERMHQDEIRDLSAAMAALCAQEAREEARAFLALGATLLLPTRLDVARRMAGTLAAARAGLAMTEAGTSADPGLGLTPITPAFLAARLRGRPE
ncbi:hypothetical protein [Rhodovarius sp.]|uniref:hypothetical protein n=1 Tax=Rhodovarius sp. TaxID=2972673 RepID=UPI0034A58D1D